MTDTFPAGSTAAPAVLGLHELARNVDAEVVEVLGLAEAHEQELALRLIEIGFLPGEPVRVIAQGHPGADPLAVRVGRSTFALRRHEASLVQVRSRSSS